MGVYDKHIIKNNYVEETIMKKWNAPEVVELKIAETADGFFDVDWEGPFNVVFGDGEDKGNKTDKTPQES